MISFSKFIAEQYLEEKLIMYNQGKRYGQIVFLAGGAGSGKGFAISNFMEKEKYNETNQKTEKGEGSISPTGYS